MEKLYNVHIRTPNRMFVFKGKDARSPVLFEKVTETELYMLEAIIKRDNILDYSITAWSHKGKSPNYIWSVVDEDKEVVVEELEDEEPSTLIEKLAREDE